jgi:hypothetical protein
MEDCHLRKVRQTSRLLAVQSSPLGSQHVVHCCFTQEAAQGQSGQLGRQ